jgi:hypothetical protein
MATIPIQVRQTSIQLEPLLTLDEAARILGRSHWSLRLDHKAGRLKCVRIGRNLMVEPSEVRRIIDKGLKTS